MNCIKTVKEKVLKFLKGLKEIIIKNKFKVIIAIALVALLIILSNMTTSENVGNSIGNVRNYGYATKSGNWIYFLSPDEKSEQIGIFKMKDGDKSQKSKKQLVMDKWDVLSLNVFKDYVYFIGISSEPVNGENLEDGQEATITDSVNNKIYRMKTDGSGLEVINDNEFDNDCYEIYIVNNHVYYIGTDYNVYKMDLDGKNRERVLENQTGYLGITDKYIIYNAEVEGQTDYVTYIADIDGKNQRPIIEGTRLYSVNIVGNYIYYTNEAKEMCRAKLDGKDAKVLYETTAYNMNVSGNYIYYLNYADELNSDYTVCIYRVKTNGSTETPEKIKNLETYSSFIDIIGNWIIYMDSNQKEGFINLLKTNGKEEIKVYSINYENLDMLEEVTGTEETVPEEDNAEETDNTENAEVNENIENNTTGSDEQIDSENTTTGNEVQ